MLHSNAWSNGTIVVVSDNTAVTSAVEESLSKDNPSIEPFIFTFNSVSDALNFSKTRPNIRLCIISDHVSGASGIAAFDNIKKVTCYAAFQMKALLLHSKVPNIDLYRKVSKRSDIIDYIPEENFFPSQTTSEFIKDLWRTFRDCIEQTIVSDETAAILFDASGTMAQDLFRSKYDRFVLIVSAQLNLSAEEVVLLKWLPYLKHLSEKNGLISNPHSRLFQLYVSHCAPLNSGATSVLANYSALLCELTTKSTAELESHLRNLNSSLRPSSTTIHRVVCRNTEKLLAIAHSIDSSFEVKASGAA